MHIRNRRYLDVKWRWNIGGKCGMEGGIMVNIILRRKLYRTFPQDVSIC